MAEEAGDVLALSVREFAAAVAAKTPTPGGGSVAGAVGSLAAALAEMSLNFTRGKKAYAAHEAYYQHLTGRLERARRMFQDLVADDISAYRLYQESTRQADGPAKEQAVQLALSAAVDVPREAAKLALALLADLNEFAPRCNKYLLSDLAAAGALAVAVLRLCDYNVRVNVPQLADRPAAEDVRAASADDLKRGTSLLADIEHACRDAVP